MIFRSHLAAQASSGAERPAFEAIAEVQQQAVLGGWFVTQPDHARISAELAAAFDPRKVANLTPAVLGAIALHDAGWMPFDGDSAAPCPPAVHASGTAVTGTPVPGTALSGTPVTFINAEPEIFLQAWAGSIQAAQSAGPLGGLMVSVHFVRLARPYLESGKGTAEQRDKVERFRERETARIERLLPMAGLPGAEIEALVAVLQLCDLASLYLCANPAAPVELPQQFYGEAVRLRQEQGGYRIEPSLLENVLVLEIPCVRWVDGKPDSKPERETVAIKLQ